MKMQESRYMIKMKMSDKIFKKFDILTLIFAISIVTIGLVSIYSATFSNGPELFHKQLTFAIVGTVIMIAVSYIPPRFLANFSVLFYIICIILLISVLFIGKRIGGNRSWFSVAGFGIQPSEFAKVATVLMLSYFLNSEEKERSIKKPKTFLQAILIVLIPIGLIMKQPDMGTSLVFFSIILPMFLWSGLSFYALFAIVFPMILAILSFLNQEYFYIGLIISIVVLLLFRRKLYLTILFSALNLLSGYSVNYLYGKLQPHQQNRIMAVLNPSSDPLGTGYNVIQSKVAIGSGGFWGKGLLQGTQTQLKFIPEQWTDFIFCVIGEELGFIGAAILILFFLFLLMKLFFNAYESKNKFLSTACIGFSSIIFFHLIINTGMTIGIMPVIGIPLPMVSYGVSSLLSFLIMLGLSMNTYRNRNILTQY
jgi:rod shape determining protein RodA